MFKISTRSLFAAIAAIVMTSFIATVPASAAKVKSIKTEAKFQKFDPETKTITAKIRKAGKKPKNKKIALKTGKEASFRVTPDGSVLTRTSVTLDAKPFPITEIEKDTSIVIYWIPDEKNPDGRYAKKIDLVLTDEEQEALDKKRLEEARSKGQVTD